MSDGTCAVCDAALTGRQLRFCSPLCKSRDQNARWRDDGRLRELRQRHVEKRKEWMRENRYRYKGKYESDREYDRRRNQRRRNEWKAHKAEVFERDDWLCGLCGAPIDRDAKFPAPWSATVDHVVPQALGGSHDLENLQAAHFICNSRKGARLSA